MKRFFFILFALLLIKQLNVQAQDEWQSYDFETTNTGNNGLLGSQVYCFDQDKDGKIWLGTSNGVNIWDGKNWETVPKLEEYPEIKFIYDILVDSKNNVWINTGRIFKYSAGEVEIFDSSNGLINEYVREMFEDKDGNIWFGTQGGISKYSESGWESYTLADGLPSETILSLNQDKNGDILLGTIDKGIWKYDGDSFSQVRNNGQIINIFIDSKDRIWSIGYGFVEYFDTEWHYVNPTIGEGRLFCHDMAEDSQGTLYFFNSNNITRMLGTEFSVLRPEAKIDGNSKWNSPIFIDKDNNVLCSTLGGFSKYNGSEWESFNTYHGLIDNQITDIFRDDKKNLWFCTAGGLSVYDGENWKGYAFTQDYNGSVLHFYTGLQDKNGKFWFGTVEGIYTYDNNEWTHIDNLEGQKIDFTKFLLEDSKGNIWVSTENGVFKFDGENWEGFNESTGMLADTFGALYEDSNGFVWIGSHYGVSKWDGTKFKHYPMTTEEFVPINPKYPGVEIKSFVEDTDGSIIVVTRSYGLYKIKDDKRTKWDKVPRAGHGDIYKDNNDVIWISTEIAGFIKYDGNEFTVYGTEVGLLNNHVTCIYRDEITGVFWFGTQNGLSKLVPDVVAEVNDSEGSSTKSESTKAFSIATEGITKPFQFSFDGLNFTKKPNFNNLTPGDYDVSITNAYDTIQVQFSITESIATSIPETTPLKTKIYPNPSTGIFHFDLQEPAKIIVYNSLGQAIISKTCNGSSDFIDLTNFTDGIYFMKSKKDGVIKTSKLIKTNQ